ncbi:Phytosulfokine, partial [Cucurbita argyrosperma subsp. argyrosperma]|uniref:Phytosulfokine n=1 Tax=Cucurbita moschata TaxID=3662 RepID=A0A6J1GEZ6_CUCMO
MSSKFFNFRCLIFLLLLLHLLCNRPPPAHAARPAPVFASLPTQGLDENLTDSENMDEKCSGVSEEECLMRRTLVAHLDYVYTQKHTP